MYQPLESYALLGDGHSAALVSLDGSIDWLCWPRFDSEAVFAALIGGRDQAGHWRIGPLAGDGHEIQRQYLDDTLVLRSLVKTATGMYELLDFMDPLSGAGQRVLYRMVRCVEGHVRLCFDLQLRFDFGSAMPWASAFSGGIEFRYGSRRVRLRSDLPEALTENSGPVAFDLKAGDRRWFALSTTERTSGAATEPDADAALSSAERFWRRWIGRADLGECRWAAQVKRSLLTLKALTYEPTGAFIAAPTTSLPEIPGGTANWDYRYSWLRDGSFGIGAFLNAGYRDDAERWVEWLLDAIAGSQDDVRIIYRVDGSRDINEFELGGLQGHRFSQPVRIGNSASTQRQIDVIGEVLYCLSLARKAGVSIGGREKVVARALCEHLRRAWMLPGCGLWESRASERHYTYSKVMAWKGVQCTLEDEQADGTLTEDRRRQLVGLANLIRQAVLDEAWHPGLGSLTTCFGSQDVDGSLLLVPLTGFLPIGDPRIRGTIDRVTHELSEGGLVRRRPGICGPGDEGTFLACACWLTDCLRLQGRRDEAQNQLERVLGVANDVGLFAEEYDVRGKHLCGNFPQALTHLAVVNAALGLSKPVADPGGG